MKLEIKILCDKAEEVYSKYVTMEGCDREELNTLYDQANEIISVRYDIDALEAFRKLLIVYNHVISGVIIENGVKVKYTNHDSIVTAEIIK